MLVQRYEDSIVAMSRSRFAALEGNGDEEELLEGDGDELQF